MNSIHSVQSRSEGLNTLSLEDDDRPFTKIEVVLESNETFASSSSTEKVNFLSDATVKVYDPEKSGYIETTVTTLFMSRYSRGRETVYRRDPKGPSLVRQLSGKGISLERNQGSSIEGWADEMTALLHQFIIDVIIHRINTENPDLSFERKQQLYEYILLTAKLDVVISLINGLILDVANDIEWGKVDPSAKVSKRALIEKFTAHNEKVLNELRQHPDIVSPSEVLNQKQMEFYLSILESVPEQESPNL